MICQNKYNIKKDLISIIVPCFNSVKYINKLLVSILSQDYSNIEIFLVDDGSIDNLEDFILLFVDKFVDKGYDFIYLQQKNSGQSAALNHALKLISGEYLVWPDSDDWYLAYNSLSKMINKFNCLSNNYAIIRCLPIYINEVTGLVSKHVEINDEYKKTYQFENALFSRNMFWAPINYMIRMKSLDEVNRDRRLFVQKNAGQNWQMLLPLFYSFKCYTLECSCAYVLERKDSHSRCGKSSYDKLKRQYQVYWDTIINTLSLMSMMPSEEKKKWKDMVNQKYQLGLLQLAISYYNINDSMNLYNLLNKQKIAVPKNTMISYHIMKIPFIGKYILTFIKTLYHKLNVLL